MVLAEHQLFEMRTSDVLISKMKNVKKKKKKKKSLVKRRLRNKSLSHVKQNYHIVALEELDKLVIFPGKLLCQHFLEFKNNSC